MMSGGWIPGGQGSFDRVMKGIDCLRRHQVDFNILTVLHRGNIKKAKELIEFYEREEFAYVQFIPLYGLPLSGNRHGWQL
ncbi:hypothetical protein ACFTAO_23890 [Paenibacillus rhizoplanae]